MIAQHTGQTIHIKLLDFGVNLETAFDPTTTCRVYAVLKERSVISKTRVSFEDLFQIYICLLKMYVKFYETCQCSFLLFISEQVIA